MRHIYQTSHDARRKNLLKQQIKARMLKKLSGLKAQDGLTAHAWDKFQVRYMKLLDEHQKLFDKAVALRDDLDEYRRTGELETEVADIAQGIVENLIMASTRDPDGGIWWILQYATKFNEREKEAR